MRDINMKSCRVILLLTLGFCFVLTLQRPFIGKARVKVEARPSAAAPPALDFYRSLTEAIDRVSGNLTIELNKTSINWRTHVAGTPDVEWKLAPSAMLPGARPMIEVFFEYRNGLIQAGRGDTRTRVEFKPEIVISPFPPSQSTAQSQVISKIYFDDDGRPVEYRDNANLDVTTKMRSWDNSGWTNLAEHLRFSVMPGGLFLNGPFRWTATPVQAGASGPFLRKLFMKTSGGGNPASGIRAELKENAAVIFSRQEAGSAVKDNSVTVAQPSSFALKSFNYDYTTQILDGSITSLDFSLHRGQLTNEGLDLRLGENSRIHFDNLAFRHSANAGGDSSINATGGIITGKMTPGSNISFAGGARQTSFTADTGSTVTFDSMSMEISNQTSLLRVGAGSRLTLHLADGRLPLVGSNFVSIKNGILSATLRTGIWRQSPAPEVSGNIDLLICEINSGVFSMVPGTNLNLRGGTMRASDLQFNAASSPALTGRFTDVMFEVEDGTTMEIPGRFIAVCRSGTRLVANDPNAPFSITAGQATVAASFRAVIPFWTCYTPPSGSPVIRDSMLRSLIVLRSNGTIGGADEIVDYTCCAK
jgi:hypothetical protein